jgi:predicted enzyme related to lactoylglutathione lyase
VLDVPAKLAARARVSDSGQGRKTDAHDAHAAVMVALRDGGCARLSLTPTCRCAESAWRVALGISVVRNGGTAITGVRESTRLSVRTIIMRIRWRQGDRMRATRIMANLRVVDIEATKSFYSDYLGLSTEEFNMGWVARYTSPDTRANVQLVTRDATAPEDPVISVHTDDVEGAYEEAQKLGYEIVHPITTEQWGVRRFFVRAPDGNVVNIVNHRD